jgi:hypothetical protein
MTPTLDYRISPVPVLRSGDLLNPINNTSLLLLQHSRAASHIAYTSDGRPITIEGVLFVSYNPAKDANHLTRVIDGGTNKPQRKIISRGIWSNET